MTKTENSPPEEGGSGENLDESGPMWDELVRLLGDEELGRGIHRQLKTAMKSQVIEAALSEDRLTRHVGRTSASVADELKKLTRDPGCTDQQLEQRIWIAAMPVIASANNAAMSEHALFIQEAHEASTRRHRESLQEARAKKNIAHL